MSIHQRYELLELKTDDGVKTFLAKQISTGRPVLAHLFPNPGSPDQRSVLMLVDSLSENERKRVFERGETDGTPFVITDRLMDHPNLRAWLTASASYRPEAVSAPAAQPPVVKDPGTPPKAAESISTKRLDDEFAALFDTPAPKPPVAMPPTLANIPIPQFAPPTPAPVDEFDVLFGGAAPGGRPVVEPAPAPAPQPKAALPTTRVPQREWPPERVDEVNAQAIRDHWADPEEPSGEQPQSAPDALELERLFKPSAAPDQGAGAAPPASARVSPRQPQGPPPGAAPQAPQTYRPPAPEAGTTGEFSNLFHRTPSGTTFGVGAGAPAQHRADPAPRPGAEFDETVVMTPQDAQRVARGGPPPPQPLPPPQAQPQGYAPMPGAQQWQQSYPQPPAGLAPAPVAPAAKKSRVGIVLGIGLLLAAIMAIALVFIATQK